jgi:D-serine deaminase-like pyridoxal phosphate-dependent protein
MVSRRAVIGGGAALVAGALLARPGDRGGPYSRYFADMNRTLRAGGIDTPVLVIDLDRLDRNIDRVVSSVSVAPAKTYRVVAKSIPSPALVDYVAKRAETTALMVFHRPFLQAMAALKPDSDILMGKPMPVSAAHQFYRQHHGQFDPERQLQWLIDTNDRLRQYLDLARAGAARLRVNLEIDVGLHRGGFVADDKLAQALQVIEENPRRLRFAGFMGYDAHLMGIPGFLVAGEIPKVKARYAECVQLLRQRFPGLLAPDLCFNGAGSPTFRNYEGDQLVNDLSAGTCLMKPAHYDLAALADFEPAAFIASPVLKRLTGGRLPALGWTGPLIRGWDRNQAQTYFGYSGNWMASCESPPGLSPSFAYISSNQQGYNASRSVDIDVDDFLFLRPHQSEAVLLQFGDLLAVRGNRIVERWPVMPAGTPVQI